MPMQGFALLGGKALEWRLEDENDKRRKLIEARCLGYTLKILSFIVSSPRTRTAIYFSYVLSTPDPFGLIRSVLFNGG